MSQKDDIRALKEPRFRRALAAERRPSIPKHPSGISFLTEAELRLVAISGGACGNSHSVITSVTIHPSCGDCGPANQDV